MKKNMLLALTLNLIVLLGCTTELVSNDEASTNKKTNTDNVDYTVTENTVADNQNSTNDEVCFTTNLIAGQHHIAGTVTVENDGENLIITYTTNGDWTIDATHLSIGGCDDGSIPTTGSGNPKIGHFEYHSTHSDGVNQVTYTISLDDILEDYCFAAHAEVKGPTGGETAWAEGTEFSGNSWAMYVEAKLSDCDENDPPSY
ncbi:hypothetical protein MWU58_02350 [Flavobacteriaceae bacterium S0825]|uniref:hypothetical protein n=1 Tax=Gaetbulibacter sp. S0825 TaxID=2720084 RepID=UPI00143158C8|nr:hypothetical protein [Gaetbulibacter sp. S0825]MCK0108127.1 hypothetical protein [Flavobacteriaceae bacterium S0825]NIX63763.1 hypothetical protein [Gaetbulibacter sp. S0825]